MAKVQFAAPVSSLSGSVGGWTFQTNRSGAIVRLRPRGLQTPSPKQAVSIATNIELITAFTSLSPGNKTLWDDFAIANTHEDRFGTTRTLTGQNWFISINRNRLLLNLSILNSPPVHSLPNGNSNFTIVIDDTKIEITKTAPTSPADTAFKIFTTPPLNRRTTSLQSSLRLTTIITAIPFTVEDITAAWVSTHNCLWPPSLVQNMFTIGIQMQLVRVSTGITIAGNTQLSQLVFPAMGIGFMTIGSTFIVD